MATITGLTYLDGGTARTAGEAWTINGGRLVIRTDTRWHLNAPASRTGSLGAITISSTLGGTYEIDGTKVRWLGISGGSGTCAIGTTITQGGVSGVFLGYWATLTSAPSTTIGATGFIKLREVTGGTFSAGALSGITASAVGADKVGWIEIVHDQAIAITVPRLGKFQVRGDWFELGVTSGVSNQLVSVPTNGSTTTYTAGVWIAKIDTPTTDEDYEYYPSLPAANMIATNLGTDARSKFVCMETNGAVRIGHNGSVAVGYVPPAGRKIRIPNVLGRQCDTGTRATNAIPNATAGTRPDFITTSAGAIDIENFSTDWYMLFAQPYSVRCHHVATFDFFNVSECATALDFYDVGTSTELGTIDARTFTSTSNFAGGLIKKARFDRCSAGAADHAVEITYSVGLVLDDVTSGIITFARSTGVAFQITQSSRIKLNNCYAINQGVVFTTCFDSELNDLDYTDRYMGTTNTTGLYAITIAASSDNIKVSGLTFGLKGTIANVHPYNGLFNVGQSSNIKIRNVGSRTAFLNGGSTNQPAYIYMSSGNNNTVALQRIYMLPTRTGVIGTTNSDKNMTYEHVYGDFADVLTVADLNSKVKNCGGTNTTTGQASVYGTHFWDAFVGDTAGHVVLSLNEPTAETMGYVSIVAGTPKFTSAGNVAMPSVGDEVVIEQDYFVKGCTALTNTAPIITGTNVTYVSNARWGNHDIYYQIDTGSGWNGTWLNLTATNLATHSISPSVGFKLKYRIVCAVANTGNLLTYIRIQTTSTLVAQTDNLYPLDTVTLTLNNLEVGARVRVVADHIEVYNDLTGSSVNVELPFYGDDIDTRIRVMYCNGLTAIKFIEFTELVGQYGLKKSISAELDNVYLSNGIDGSAVTTVEIDDSSLLVNVNDNAITWAEIYAYETYWLATEEGIRDEGRFIEAVDNANYIIDDFKIKNVGANPLVITGGWAWDRTTGRSIDLIDTTGNTIFNAPDHVVSYAAGGSALTTEEHTKLMSVATKGDIWASAVLGVS